MTIPTPRRRTAPSGDWFEARGPWGRGSHRASEGGAPASSQEGRADRRSDPLPARPPRLLPPPRGGAQAGGGAPRGRGAISIFAGGFARTSLGAFPARRQSLAALLEEERRGRRQEAGNGPGRRAEEEQATAPSVSPARSDPRPAPLPHSSAPLNGFSSQREEAPGRSWGGGPPCSPGSRERRIRRGGPRLGWRRPLPGERRLRQVSVLRPAPLCPRPGQAPRGDGGLEGSWEGSGLRCAPVPRTSTERRPKSLAEIGRAGFRSGSTLGTGFSSRNFN